MDEIEDFTCDICNHEHLDEDVCNRIVAASEFSVDFYRAYHFCDCRILIKRKPKESINIQKTRIILDKDL